MGLLTMHSFMFNSSYEKLRALIGENAVVETVVHYGPGRFAVGNPGTLQTAAFVLRREQLEMERPTARGVYFRLVKEPDTESKRIAFEQALARRRTGQPDARVYAYCQGDFAAIPSSPWVYWITQGLLELFRKNKNLGDISRTYCGMTTSDNERYLRFWWEVASQEFTRSCRTIAESVASGKTWFPYMKGGPFRRWYGNQQFVVNWRKDGAEILQSPSFPRAKTEYFRRGITWTEISTGRFGARLSPGGFIFDVKGSSAFPKDVPTMLGLLNSELLISSPCS